MTSSGDQLSSIIPPGWSLAPGFRECSNGDSLLGFRKHKLRYGWKSQCVELCAHVAICT